MNPKKSVAGITVDPYTRERVIPESRRADGSLRQQRKVRPGYTPQEDVSLFRGSRQAVSATQNRHAPGYLPPGAPPPKAAGAGAGGDKPLSKSAAKNAKRRAKKQTDKEQIIKDNWDSDSDGDKSGRKQFTSEEKEKEDKKDPPKDKEAADEEALQEIKKDIDPASTLEDTEDVGSDLATEVAKIDLGS